MKFLVDANLGRKFTKIINKAGYDAVFINDLLVKASDEDILSIAERENRALITNDKDFGKLVFKLGKSSTGVILLRTLITDSERRFEMEQSGSQERFRQFREDRSLELGNSEFNVEEFERRAEQRFEEFRNLGAKFSKWRAVITIGDGIPTQTCIDANSEALARFAALSQEAGLVPIVEPEVLMDGGHDIVKCEQVTYQSLKSVFAALPRHKILITGMLLKPNMILPGKESEKATAEQVADSTLRIFKEVVPSELAGVVFLSGGQAPEEATLNLNAINAKDEVPWQLSFSYGRALQEPVLKAWKGNNDNKEAAQKAFYHRAKMNSLARYGKYAQESENE